MNDTLDIFENLVQLHKSMKEQLTPDFIATLTPEQRDLLVDKMKMLISSLDEMESTIERSKGVSNKLKELFQKSLQDVLTEQAPILSKK